MALTFHNLSLFYYFFHFHSLYGFCISLRISSTLSVYLKIYDKKQEKLSNVHQCTIKIPIRFPFSSYALFYVYVTLPTQCTRFLLDFCYFLPDPYRLNFILLTFHAHFSPIPHSNNPYNISYQIKKGYITRNKK